MSKIPGIIVKNPLKGSAGIGLIVATHFLNPISAEGVLQEHPPEKKPLKHENFHRKKVIFLKLLSEFIVMLGLVKCPDNNI